MHAYFLYMIIFMCLKFQTSEREEEFNLFVAKQHVDVPIPKPQADEILVKVEVAGVNPLDWRLQEGIARPILPRKFPFVPGLLHLPITKIIVLK